ncbi:MAG TPA: hypothetical protein VHY08_01300, partial [Bacillota bacterium]|nr:hypothetical protein [Bacillota bacterium]
MKRIIIILFLGVFLCQSFLLTVAFTANTLPISNETIVFLRNVTGSWDIWTYQCSSRELKQITNTLEDEQNPVWLNGKNEIAFIRSGAIYTWSQNGEKRITQENNYRFLSYDKKNHRLLFSKFIKSEE